ncbi:MAG: FAD-dependent oxidoreductase [Oscillospiraceae bacterium]|nr:FAD-dependent oxidoreductase [Oscillospiraceae bacterium]
MERCDLVIIGAGPAGLAAAIAAREAGVQDILLLERDKEAGGILNQCIHSGFGLHTFKEELTGPEYAQRYIDRANALEIPCMLNTMVLELSSDRVVTAMNREKGLFQIKAGAVILAMGCRERARGSLNIPGFRPAGIYSAGTAQRLVNMEGYLPGREVVILGSGDIGLIMARRMTLEGAHVQVVAELMPYSGGLKRNIVQCLDDFGIPLKLSHTVVDIHGRERVTGVTIAQVDENRRPIPGTEHYYDCDTLLLSVGLIPENELSRAAGVEISPITNGPIVNESLETSVPGVFACGNVLHVHDLVDFVSEEAANAGRRAAKFLSGYSANSDKEIRITAKTGVRYTVPSHISPERMDETAVIRFRVADVYRNATIVVRSDTGEELLRRKRMIVAPGEMEEITLKRADLLERNDINEITVTLEVAQ